MSYSILRTFDGKLGVVVELPSTASDEQLEVIGEFAQMLVAVTADGGRKRARGEKPSWKVDQSHRAAIFSHINKREHGELKDPDSGAHPYVHLAWRALAVAWQESQPAPAEQPQTAATSNDDFLHRVGRLIAEERRSGKAPGNPDDIAALLRYYSARLEALANSRPLPQAIFS